MAAGTIISGTRPPVVLRAALLLIIALVHAVLILCLLRAAGIAPADLAERRLVLFDVTPLPPPVPAPILSPPPKPEISQARSVGGSPGRQRTPPAKRVAFEHPERPAAFETTITDASLPITVASDGDGSVPVDLGSGGAAGIGLDAGSGNGSGDGTTIGRGLPRWARADWIIRPTGSQVLGYMPKAAREAGQGGRVILACSMSRPGPPDSCRIVFEQPAGWSFGEAALAMRPIFRIRPVRRGGRIMPEVPIYVPVRFSVNGKPGPS